MEWKCIFYEFNNGDPIDVSSLPSPRVGFTMVGVLMFVSKMEVKDSAMDDGDLRNYSRRGLGRAGKLKYEIF